MQREKRKQLRIAGKEYISKAGKFVNAKSIGADCKCKKKCYEIVPESQRKVLFENYYNLSSYDEQNTYLYQFIRKNAIGRKRTCSDRRSCTFHYYVRLQDMQEVQVCKEAFANIHGVSSTKVRMICEKIRDNVSVVIDKRGCHKNRPHRINEQAATKLINQHLCSILDTERISEFEHNGRPSFGGLNVSKMWAEFSKAQSCKSNNEEISVKSWLYYRLCKDLISTKYPHLLHNRKEEPKACEMVPEKRDHILDLDSGNVEVTDELDQLLIVQDTKVQASDEALESNQEGFMSNNISEDTICIINLETVEMSDLFVIYADDNM